MPNLQALQHRKRGLSISYYLAAETSPPTPIVSVKLRWGLSGAVSDKRALAVQSSVAEISP